MFTQCEDCGHHFVTDPEGDVQNAACPDCGGTRMYRGQPNPTVPDGTLRNMVDSDSQKDQGGNPLGEGTIMGRDGEDPIWKRDNFTHGKVAGPMEDLIGLEPEQRTRPAFMRWEPGKHGRGLIINGEPHTWSVYDPKTVQGPEDFGYTHPEYVENMGINRNLVDFGTGVEITPDGGVESINGRDPMPYIQADPRLKPVETSHLFNFSMAKPKTFNTELYSSFEHVAEDVEFDKGPLAPPEYTATVQPGPQGIHARHGRYLQFLDAHVNGKSARQQPNEIVRRYGFHDSPEFGQPVTVAVHHPQHLEPLVSQLQSPDLSPTPQFQEMIEGIRSGQVPAPPGVDPTSIAPIQRAANTKTAGPALAIGAEALGGLGEAGAAGAAGAGGMGLGDIAPSLMKGALMGTGSQAVKGLMGGGGGTAEQPGNGAGTMPAAAPGLGQLAAVLVAKGYETPSSNPDVGVKHDDPEDVDQKEFNDQDHNPNPINPNMEDSGASGEDEVRDKAGFGPDSVGLQRLNLLLPLVLHFFNSEESGINDPMLKSLHELLESENPGYLESITPEDEEKARHHVEHHKHNSKVALVPPMQPGGLQMPSSDPAMQQQQQGQMQGRCPNCGGVLAADGSCPQCGSKVGPQGGAHPPGASAPMMGGPSMPPGYSSITGANHQGPITPEQIAAVQQLLIQEHRVDEVPNVPLKPQDYVREMAQIQNNPDVAPQLQQGEQPTTPPAPQEQAPGAMPMPSPGAPGPGGAPMTPLAALAADNIAKRCPECNSATTGVLNGDGDHYCHSCGNVWKVDGLVPDGDGDDSGVTSSVKEAEHPEHHHEDGNTMGVPSSEQEAPHDVEKDDSSLTWKDESGQPLIAGQEYEMKDPSYTIPDIVRVIQPKPDGLELEIIGEYSNDPNALTAKIHLTREQAEMQGITFAPIAENADDRGNEAPSAAPGHEQVPPSGQTTDEYDNTYPQLQSNVVASIDDIAEPENDGSCPKCGNRVVEASMSSPTTVMHECFRCSHVWETKDEMSGIDDGLGIRSWVLESNSFGDDFFGEMERARAMAEAGGNGSRNLSSIAAKDPRLQQVKDYLASQAEERQQRVAGKHFSPSEQRELIDEEGSARNSDLLDLKGTHYTTRYDHTGKANAGNVPDEHLVMGL